MVTLLSYPTVINMLLLNSFLMSAMLILPPGIAGKNSSKPQEKLSLQMAGCQKDSSQEKSCPSQNLDNQGLDLTDLTAEETLKVQEYFKKSEALQDDKAFQDSIKKDVQKLQNIFQDPSVQEVMKSLQTKSQESFENTFPVNNSALGELYVFVSLSMGEKALLNLAQEAAQYGATLILRGFIEGSYTKTVRALSNIITKTGQGVSIDPELFTLFSITAVPIFILAKPFSLMKEDQTFTPLHDRLQGHVSVQYALETFTKKGDLKAEAQAFLQQAIFVRGQVK